MRTHLWKAVLTGTLITMSAAACGDDTPLDEGVGEIEQLQFDRGFASVAPGDTITFSVAPRDQFGNTVDDDVEFEACDNKITIGDVRPDSAELFPRTIVEVIGTNNLGYSCIVASAGGVTDSVTVLVVPPFLLTNVSEAEGGDTIIFIRSLGQPAFDSDVSVTAQIQAPPPADFIHSAFVLRERSTADSLYVVLPINAAAGDYEFTISNIGAGQATIGSSLVVTALGTAGPDIDNPDGGATDTVGLTLPAEVVSELTQEESNDWFRITVAEAGVLDMKLQWDYGNNGADFVALYLYNKPGSVAVGDRLVLTYAAAPDPADLHAEVELEPGNYWVRVRNLDAEHTPTTYYLSLEMVE